MGRICDSKQTSARSSITFESCLHEFNKVENKPNEKIRKIAYFFVGIIVLIGIFFMRWNVVIGGQLFSKSLSGFTSFNAVYSGLEGYGMVAVWLILPLLIFKKLIHFQDLLKNLVIILLCETF